MYTLYIYNTQKPKLKKKNNGETNRDEKLELEKGKKRNRQRLIKIE